jgi:hypothetical protein
VAVVAAIGLLGACGSDDAADRADRTPSDVSSTTTDGTAADGSLADAVRPLPPAAELPAVDPERPAPEALAIAALDVDDAPIVAVGLEPNGDMEIPAVDQVGWYRYSAHPGDPGTAVLAAHIAYDGVDGVFRHLAELEPGDEITIGPTTADMPQRFVVDEITRYPKSDLPAEVWTRTGPPRLALITCGGDFDPTTHHYADNIVAWASPA